MHGRDLRARSVASVDEYVDLLSGRQKEVAARLRESFAHATRNGAKTSSGMCRCIRWARPRSLASKDSGRT